MTNLLNSKETLGKPSLGLFLISGNSMIAETISTVPVDWLVIDMEASPMSKQDALHVIQSLNGSEVFPIVRVPMLSRHYIEHSLDMGALGVLIPKIDTAVDAQTAANACYYPPLGFRGVNPVRSSRFFSQMTDYFSNANQRVACIVQIESAQAVENVEEIAQVSGVDMLFIGIGDLASSYGQAGSFVGEKLDLARKRVLAAAQQSGKNTGIFAYTTELAQQYINEGFSFIGLGNDIKLLREAALQKIEELR